MMVPSTEVQNTPTWSLMPWERGRIKSARQRLGSPGAEGCCWRSIGNRSFFSDRKKIKSSPSLQTSKSRKMAWVWYFSSQEASICNASCFIFSLSSLGFPLSPQA